MGAEKSRAPDPGEGAPITGWIDWGGGPCPVRADVAVEIVCRDGMHMFGAAGDYAGARNDGADWWIHSQERPAAMPGAEHSDDDIVRYRLLAS